MAEASPTRGMQDPAADAQPSPDTPEPPTSEDKEALQYWGFLVKKDKCGTELLNRLLSGIAQYIVRFGQHLTVSNINRYHRRLHSSPVTVLTSLPHSLRPSTEPLEETMTSSSSIHLPRA
jgi:hypothetical protein